ncbi:Protein bcp1 [Smittium mucronatum]|uniref:Protein BCP1 n=1 Tax=Smittium mucronatum TaxID=133383 RepID=A0A1R0H539_9FUNG|nr:Protein bcp1 [Smittium mucronatum]
MSKRSHSDIVEKFKKADFDSDSGSESEDSNDMDIVNVDFDFFDPKDIDFHAIKRMVSTMFADDQDMFDTSELANMIVNQKLVGSTVKVSGEDDPYAFLTVLNMNSASNKIMDQIKKYLLDKCSRFASSETRSKFSEIMSTSSTDRVGLLINERLVNMPAQIVPPMFKMLFEELEWAINDNEPYDFDYYILIAPIYNEIQPPSSAPDDATTTTSTDRLIPGHVPSGPKKSRVEPQTFYFHPEDEFIEPFVALKFDFRFSKNQRPPETRDSFNDFGLLPSKRCFVIHKSNLLPIYNKIHTVFKP